LEVTQNTQKGVDAFLRKKSNLDVFRQSVSFRPNVSKRLCPNF